MTNHPHRSNRIVGHAAIAYAETRGLPLNKFTDPTEAARAGLSISEAREIAREDDALIWIAKPSRIQVIVDGVVYPIERDVAHVHPTAVHAAMGTSSETELQRGLDTMNASDWYDENGRHLGPDVNGLEMFKG